MKRSFCMVCLVAWIGGCESDAPIASEPDGSTDAIVVDATPDATPDGSVGDAEPDGEKDGGSLCTPTPVARLCVRGTPGGPTGGESLAAGGPVRFDIYPDGCHSTACTVAQEASCTVMQSGTTAMTLDGGFCLRTEGECVTPDCSGGGFASCDSGTVSAGNYTATLGTLTVDFAVPSTLPAGGRCVELLGANQVCDPAASACGSGLSCCYPCGTPGCDFLCEPTCEAGSPGCVDGCIPRP
ncbi:MAG: hypothetical protein AAGF12_43930 [Myxococcota bacterium]